jgi:FlaA1/EpsC-like NDP-sugar epimerase
MTRIRLDSNSRFNQIAIDGLIFATSFAVAYLVRFGGIPSWPNLKQFLIWVPYLVAGRLYVNWKLGIYKFIWRYVSLRDAIAIARSLAIVSAVMLAARFLYPGNFILAARLHISVSVITLEYLLSLMGCFGVRALTRTRYQREVDSGGQSLKPTRILVIGAGQAGIRLAKEMEASGQAQMVGFLDDDPRKIGALINHIKVLGPTSSLPSAVREHEVDQVVIAITRPPRETLKRLWALSEDLPVEMKVIPTLDEILQGKLNIGAFRQVQMDDLLGRETVDLAANPVEVIALYGGKRIMITGAGGSIGSELAHQMYRLMPKDLILLDKDENGLNDVYCHLASNDEGLVVHPVVADIRYRERLKAVFEEFRPEVVFHAAAHKHVPLMEMNPCEAVLNNVLGTRNLVEEAKAAGASHFIFISTDKAVKPLSVMGATKRVCELIVQAHSNNGQETRFACVRFGNVMGSRGSVIPLFQKQIARGGPVTLTHPDMKRYMMTIPEAVRLVIQAGVLASCGEIFVLDMGDPVTIVDLANDLIELSGLRPGKDIRVEVTQLRPGEKITEELFDRDLETSEPTRFEKIWVARPKAARLTGFEEKLAALENAALQNSPQDIQRMLPEFNLVFESAQNRTAGQD